ncbi:MAG: flagellar biosynthetic protein FliO [Pseudomonadota bacterium]
MELIDIARIVFALIAVIGMIGLAAVAARKLGLQNGALSLARARRLSLVETLPIDQRRRAAIIACDGREHLIILDAARVTVIERGLPQRETASGEEPVAVRAHATPSHALHVPAAVSRFLKRAGRDQIGAFRAAGAL